MHVENLIIQDTCYYWIWIIALHTAICNIERHNLVPSYVQSHYCHLKIAGISLCCVLFKNSKKRVTIKDLTWSSLNTDDIRVCILFIDIRFFCIPGCVTNVNDIHSNHSTNQWTMAGGDRTHHSRLSKRL